MREIHLVILNWNGLSETERCLESVHGLRAPEDAEIRVWLVDNGSSDGSPEILPQRFPWVRFLTNPENLRFAGGVNAGAEAALEAGADFVLLLNNDTEVDPELIVDLIEEADRHQEAGLLGPLILDATGRVWFGGGGVALGLGWTWHEHLGRLPEPRSSPSRETGYLTGCALLIRRRVLEEVGKLDEGYYLYAEDVDFSLRVQNTGFTTRLVPKARVIHHVSSSSGGRINPFKAYQRTRANLRLFARHTRGAQRLTWRFGFLIMLVAQSGSWILRGVPAAVPAAWRALWDEYRGRPAAEAFPVSGRAGGAS